MVIKESQNSILELIIWVLQELHIILLEDLETLDMAKTLSIAIELENQELK